MSVLTIAVERMSCQSHSWRQEASLLKSGEFIVVNRKDQEQVRTLQEGIYYETKTLKEMENKVCKKIPCSKFSAYLRQLSCHRRPLKGFHSSQGRSSTPRLL